MSNQSLQTVPLMVLASPVSITEIWYQMEAKDVSTSKAAEPSKDTFLFSLPICRQLNGQRNSTIFQVELICTHRPQLACHKQSSLPSAGECRQLETIKAMLTVSSLHVVRVLKVAESI